MSLKPGNRIQSLRTEPCERAPDESGAVIAYFAVIMAVLIGVAGFVVDGGRLWNQRRSLVVATDSAALAGAGSGRDGQDPCTKAIEYLNANDQAVINPSCVEVSTVDGGIVEVSGRRPVDYTFASLIGVESATAIASTAAAWNQPGVTGLRPLAICEQAAPELTAWLADPDSSSLTLRIYMASTHSVAVCSANGSAPGNWGLVDLDGGSNGTPEINNYLTNGYGGRVTVSDSTVSCQIDSDSCYDGSPGAISNSISSGLSSLQSSGEIVPFALYRSAEGNGSNLQFRFSKIARARVVGYKVTGKNSKRFIELEFQPGLLLDGDTPAVLRICGSVAADC